jgi:hypothetical protein
MNRLNRLLNLSMLGVIIGFIIGIFCILLVRPSNNTTSNPPPPPPTPPTRTIDINEDVITNSPQCVILPDTAI